MSDYETETIDDETKAEIAAEFLKYAPPGEFNEVYNDVAVLVDDENILKKGAAEAVPHYNLEQFLPVDVPNSKDKLRAEIFSSKFINWYTSEYELIGPLGTSECLKGNIETSNGDKY